jgi:FMN phosphatase YigB (HAD superfamily)
LSEAQLRTLIGAAAGEHILGLIDHVFCSSEHGVSKAQGLFGPVLKTLGCAPEQILHMSATM